jgi:hypothetical protein
MADNTNAPFGFIPANPIRGSHWYVAGATAAAIYPGDVVAVRADGKIGVAAAAGTQLMGVAASYKSATYSTILIWDDPDQQFLCMDDGSGTTAIGTVRIGLNSDIVATVGNGTVLKSRQTFDRNPAGTATAQLRLLGVTANQATGKYQVIRVAINEHFLKKSTGVV